MKGIPIIIYWDGEEMGTCSSITQAGIITNLSATTVSKLLREGGATVGGFSFAKAEEEQ